MVDYYPVENSTTFIDKGIHFDDLSEEDRKAIEDQYREEGTAGFEEAPPSDINKFVFNKDTVKKVIEELMENGIKTDAGDKLGKTIIFAYNKKHAQFIVDTFEYQFNGLISNISILIADNPCIVAIKCSNDISDNIYNFEHLQNTKGIAQAVVINAPRNFWDFVEDEIDESDFEEIDDEDIDVQKQQIQQ